MTKESCEKEAKKIFDGFKLGIIGEIDVANYLHRLEVEAFNQGIETAAKTSEEFNSINVEMDGISCITEAIRNKLKKGEIK